MKTNWIHKNKNPHVAVNVKAKKNIISQNKFYHIPDVKIFDFFRFLTAYQEIAYPANYVLLMVC